MRKIFTLASLAAAAMMLFSCAKETAPVQEGQYSYTFNIATDNTKAVLNEDATAYEWVDNDAINVYASSSVKGTVTSAGIATATFSSELSDGDKVYATFPYSECNSATGSVVFSIPAEQDGATIKDAMPMYSEALEVEAGSDVSGTFKMHNLGAVLKFQVYGTSHTSETVTSITYAAEGIAGNFASVDITNSPALAEGDADAVTATASSVAVGSSADDAGLVYMVVAPAAASTTGTITVVTSTSTYTATLPSALSLNANDLVTVPLNLENSAFTSTKNYYFTSVKTLAALATTSTETEYTGTLSNAIVSGVYGSYVHIEDADAGILLYMASSGLSAGDVINGEVTCKIKLYNSLPELASITLGDDVVTSGGEAPLTTVTIEKLLENYDSYLCKRIQIVQATVTGAITSTTSASSSVRTGSIKQGDSSINTFVQLKTALTGAAAGDVVTLICYPGLYSSTKQVYVYSDDDITILAMPKIESINPTSVSFAKDEAAGTSKTVTITTANATNVSIELNDSDEAFEVSEVSGADNTYTFTVSNKADASEKAHAATITVTATDGTNSVSSDVVVSQSSTTATTQTYTHTFEKSQITKTAGDVKLSDITWTQTALGYVGFNSSTGVQLGSKNSPATDFKLSTKGISGTIKSVKINAKTGGTGTLAVSVGGTDYTCGTSKTPSLTTELADYEFTGASSGEIVINLKNTSKAAYMVSITVTYEN